MMGSMSKNENFLRATGGCGSTLNSTLTETLTHTHAEVLYYACKKMSLLFVHKQPQPGFKSVKIIQEYNFE